jgi:hypothetical protein
MPDDQLHIEGLEELEDWIRRSPDVALEVAEPAMRDALLYLHGRIPEYPRPPEPGTASKFWTDKQRRWFWWQVSEGNTALFDYRRTGTLGRRITEKVKRTLIGVEGELGMNTPYARQVIGRGTQAVVHRGRWWIFEDVIDENASGALDEFSETFFRLFGESWSEGEG